MKPVIAMLAEIEDDLSTKIKYSYIRAIEGSGGIPLLVPYIEDRDTLEDIVAIADGFFFTGGADINPRLYGEEQSAGCGTIKHKRDALEFSIIERVLNSQKPILAICRGLQLLNVALGGKLYQDIPSELCTNISHVQKAPNSSPSHEVTVIPDTPLYALTVRDRMTVNSFHHQAIKSLCTGLKAMALADDGIIEAVFSEGNRYIRAYQWHPERLYDVDANNKKIFDDFTVACKSIGE